MNGRKAATQAGISYNQLDYWVRIGVITPSTHGQYGKDHEFTPRDVAWLKTAATMRKQGYRLSVIREAIKNFQKAIEIEELTVPEDENAP